MLSCVSRWGEFSGTAEQAPSTKALRMAIHLMAYSPAGHATRSHYRSNRMKTNGLFVFVWLSDNRRLAILGLIRLLVFVVIAIVWVARRHRIADKVQPGETVFRETRGHDVIRATATPCYARRLSSSLAQPVRLGVQRHHLCA